MLNLKFEFEFSLCEKRLLSVLFVTIALPLQAASYCRMSILYSLTFSLPVIFLSVCKFLSLLNSKISHYSFSRVACAKFRKDIVDG